MRKEIKNSFDELFEEVNLFENGRAKPKRISKFMPLLTTIVISAAVLLFFINQISQQNQSSQQNQTANQQEINNVEIPYEENVEIPYEETQTIINDQTLEKELNTAVIQPGIPNMVEPDAKIIFKERKISIWLLEGDSVIIIYGDEPNSYYIVPHAPVLKKYASRQSN